MAGTSGLRCPATALATRAASDRHRLEVEDFAGALLPGRAPRLGLAETLRNLEVIDRLLAASR